MMQRTLFFHKASPCMGQLRSYHCTLYRTMADNMTSTASAAAGEASQYRSIVLAPSKTADRTKYERYTRNQEVTPSTLIRKTILDNGNEFITPNTLFKEVKKHEDAFKSKRHFKRVLTPMRLGNQFAIAKIKDDKGSLKYAYRLKNTRYVKDLLAQDQLRLQNASVPER